MRRFVLAALVAAFAAGQGRADDTLPADKAAQREAESADKFDVDLFSPRAPALITLGVSPQNADDAGVFADFGYDFASVGDSGKLGLGVAVSGTPYWWVPRELTLDEYRNGRSPLERISARTQLSLGAARAGTEHHEAIALAFGIQTQLLDAQDPKFDAASYDCVHEAWQRLRRPAHQEAVQDIAAEIAKALQEGKSLDLEALQEQQLQPASSEDFEAARRHCRDEAGARLLARPSWKIGLGLGARSDEPSLGHFDYDGVSLWSAYRQPLDVRGRYALFGFLRGDLHKVFDMQNDLSAEGKAATAGLGAAYQLTWLRVEGAASFNRRDFDTAGFGRDDFLRYSGTVDVRIRDGLWLEAGGGAFSGSDFLRGAFYSASVKINWGIYSPF